MAITLTENAADQIRKLLAKRSAGYALRIGVKKVGCSGYAYTYDYADQAGAGDHTYEAFDARVVVDSASLAFIDGSRLDYISEGLKQMFKFDNPNVDSTCGCGESFNTKAAVPAA